MAYLAAPQLDYAGGSQPLAASVLVAVPHLAVVVPSVYGTVTVPDVESLVDIDGGTVGFATG